MGEFNKQKVIDGIVDDFAECRLSSYWFPKSGTQIEWSSHQEVYLILRNDKTWSYAEPRHLEMYVENLHLEDLKEYRKEQY